MVYTWGGPDIQSSPQQIDSVLPTVAPQPTLPGFDRFMIERFSPLCWAIPTQPTFDPRDAQGRLVLAEAASLQKAIYAKTGQEYLTWLREAELRGTGMDAATVEGYLVALGTLDLKGFRQFFQVRRIYFKGTRKLCTANLGLEPYAAEQQVTRIHCRRFLFSEALQASDIDAALSTTCTGLERKALCQSIR